MTKEVTQEFYDAMMSDLGSGYLGMAWALKGEDGSTADTDQLMPSRYICVQNYYGELLLYIDAKFNLVPCVVKD